jgi:hypothetical protein
MWVFTRSSFLSIIADDADPDMLSVRARMRGDIHGLWPKVTVDCTPRRDYRYRAKISRQDVVAALQAEVCSINYSNFKDSIRDKRRSPFYAWIWMAACDMQDALESSDRPYRKPIE